MLPFKMRPIEAALAWRNVWKNKRRTVLTLLTIAVGCAMVIFFMAMQEGAYDAIIENMVSANTAHIQIHEKGFWENRSIDYAFIPHGRVMRALASEPSISGFAMRVHAAGLVSSGEASDIALIQGVDPEDEKRICTLHASVRKGGRYLRPGDTTEVLIGEDMASNLEVKVGDRVLLLSQGFDGSIAGARKLTVVGLFKTGNPEYDRMLMLMTLEQAKEMFSMGEYVTSIAVKLRDGTMMPAVRDALKRRIADPGLEIMGWDELMPELMQYVVMDRTSAYVFYFVLYLTVAFGVLNTIQMSVYERTREFGVMLAIGTSPNQILGMVLLESALISLIGIAVGSLIGSAISWYFTVFPLDYSEFQKEMEIWGLSVTKVPAKLALSYVIEAAGVVFVISMLFTIFPARRAARLRPIDAIRTL